MDKTAADFSRHKDGKRVMAPLLTVANYFQRWNSPEKMFQRNFKEDHRKEPKFLLIL
jgi:hypothetical protein